MKFDVYILKKNCFKILEVTPGGLPPYTKIQVFLSPNQRHLKI